jgi:hypothetical protein
MLMLQILKHLAEIARIEVDLEDMSEVACAKAGAESGVLVDDDIVVWSRVTDQREFCTVEVGDRKLGRIDVLTEAATRALLEAVQKRLSIENRVAVQKRMAEPRQPEPFVARFRVRSRRNLS